MSLNLRLRRLFQTLLVTVAFIAQTSSAAAETKYPSYLVDILVNNCMAQKTRDTHAVYSTSPIGFGFCSYGAADLPSHRKVALDRCTRQIPRRLRSSIKCGIVVEDGKVVNRSLLSGNRKEFAAPADIEIYDGKTRSTESRRGFVVTGRYVSASHVTMRISLESGKLLCEGFQVENSSGQQLQFEGKCFGQFAFNGTLLQPSDVFLYKGDYVNKMSFTLRRGESFIKVTTGP